MKQVMPVLTKRNN